MTISNTLREKLLAQLEVLIASSEEVLQTAEERTGSVRVASLFDGTVLSRNPNYQVVDASKMVSWATRCINVLNSIIHKKSPSSKIIEEFQNYGTPQPHTVQYLVGRLTAIRDDFRDGFLNDPACFIRAEVAGDYLSQAETLWEQGYYVPAAVLAGAVLEDTLRKLCEDQEIPLETDKGGRKTIDPLNTDLAKCDIYSSVKAQEIRGWAAVRNAAAHGRIGDVDSDAVRRMLDGIHSFVCEHLH